MRPKPQQADGPTSPAEPRLHVWPSFAAHSSSWQVWPIVRGPPGGGPAETADESAERAEGGAEGEGRAAEGRHCQPPAQQPPGSVSALAVGTQAPKTAARQEGSTHTPASHLRASAQHPAGLFRALAAVPSAWQGAPAAAAHFAFWQKPLRGRAGAARAAVAAA